MRIDWQAEILAEHLDYNAKIDEISDELRMECESEYIEQLQRDLWKWHDESLSDGWC